MNNLKDLAQGDRVTIVTGTLRSSYPVAAATEDYIVLKGCGRSVHLKYSAALGAWTQGGRKVELEAERRRKTGGQAGVQ